MRFAAAVLADLLAVLVFALVGRGSHAEANSLAGVLGTGWPFLLAVVAGSCVARGWRRPTGWRTGVIVWLTTSIGGLLVRMLAGDTAAWPFWIVTVISFAVLQLGWRLLARIVLRLRRRRSGRAAPGSVSG